jgi:hypothetical protein
VVETPAPPVVVPPSVPPVPTPTFTPPAPPTDFWVDGLPYGKGPHRGQPTGPTISNDSDWTWQRDSLWMHGEQYRHGLAVHAPSTVTIDLNRSCSTFEAVAGLDDFAPQVEDVVFSVQGDGGRTLWSSGAFRPGDAPLAVRVPLAGQQSVRLVVTPAGGRWALINLSDWAEARFTCS